MSDHKIPMLREIIEERKTKAIETLTVSYAKNRLPLEEYERLVEYINKIESERELAVIEKITAEYKTPEPAASRNTGPGKHNGDYGDEDDDSDSGDEHYNDRNVELLPGNMAFFSSRNVSGPVKSGTQYVSFFGSTRIKVRKADLVKRRTELNVLSVFGENTFLVEPGIRVINKVLPVLGEASVNRKVSRLANDYEPELVISGVALLGSVSVKPLKE